MWKGINEGRHSKVNLLFPKKTKKIELCIKAFKKMAENRLKPSDITRLNQGLYNFLNLPVLFPVMDLQKFTVRFWFKHKKNGGVGSK